MLQIDGKPLVPETAARADMAGEYGTLFANHRNALLENVALVQHIDTLAATLSIVRAALTESETQLQKVTQMHEALANQVRGKVVPARRKV